MPPIRGRSPVRRPPPGSATGWPTSPRIARRSWTTSGDKGMAHPLCRRTAQLCGRRRLALPPGEQFLLPDRHRAGGQRAGARSPARASAKFSSCRRRIPAQETWTGHILTPDEGAQDLGHPGSLGRPASEALPRDAVSAGRDACSPKSRPRRRGTAAAGRPCRPPSPIPLDVAPTFRDIIARAAKGEASVHDDHARRGGASAGDAISPRNWRRSRRRSR